MKRVVVTATTALLAGCATPQPVSAPYRATGTEPFWSLTIEERTITFTLSGSAAVQQPTPRVIVGFAGEIYRTKRIDVNIVHGACSDGMSDRTYPDKVQVRVDEHHFNGCGGL